MSHTQLIKVNRLDYTTIISHQPCASNFQCRWKKGVLYRAMFPNDFNVTSRVVPSFLDCKRSHLEMCLFDKLLLYAILYVAGNLEYMFDFRSPISWLFHNSINFTPAFLWELPLSLPRDVWPWWVQLECARAIERDIESFHLQRLWVMKETKHIL